MEKSEAIRRISKSDLTIVQEFIHKYWASNHVLTLSKELFDWYYFNIDEDSYNFYAAFTENKLTGILGYTSNKQFDCDIKSSFNWLSMWKISKNAHPGQGLRILKTLELELGKEPIGTIGCNVETKKLYEKLGYTTGQLQHLVVPGTQHYFEQLLLYKFKDISKLEEQAYLSETLKLVKFNRAESEDLIYEFEKFMPFGKSAKFYINRYLKNPFYTYQFAAILSENKRKIGFIVYRVHHDLQFNVIRILEIVSSTSDLNLYYSIMDLNNKYKSQYADYYQFRNTAESALFGMLEVDQTMNIPNLFEPLILTKKLFHFALKNVSNQQFTLSRGDCDQDRPNKI